MYISAVGSINAAWKLQQSHNNKHNKRNISTNSSCPYIKLFLPPPPLTPFLLLLYVYTLEQKNLLIKAEKELCGSAGGEVFFLFFSGVAWAGLANCV